MKRRTVLVACILWSLPGTLVAQAQAAKEPAPPPAGAPPSSAAAPPPPGTPQTAVAAHPAEVDLSFQGAEIDVVVKWLAEVTGKSIVKHKGVQVKLNVLSSKKLPVKEAIGLVYRALALEGFSAVETPNVIVIVPEALESKVGTELIDESESPREGKQILVKVFKPQQTQAAQLKDKLRAVLSEKAKIEVDEHANKLIVTDYADNMQLVGELIKELDVSTIDGTVTEIILLKNVEAETLATLLGAIYSGVAPTPSSGPGGAPPGGPQPPGGPPPGGASPGKAGDGVKSIGVTVRFVSHKASNRLIVTAPREKMAEIKAMITTLDSPKPVDVAVRVIPLKHVNARDLVQEIGPLYQRVRGESVKDSIEIAANSRSNSLIVLSSEANYKEITKMVAELDTEEAQEQVMKAFPLRNADAEDVAQQLTDLHQSNEEDGYYRYFFSSRNRSQEGKVRFVADRRRNTVIVIGPPGAMQRLEDLIKALDAPVEGEDLVPKIYPLKYVSAFDVEDVLNTLFLKKSQNRRPYWYDDYQQENEQRNIGRLYGKVRIASETYTNSIIVTSNSPENFAAVETILRQLDVPSPTGETTLNLPLKYAKAVNISNNINILFAQAGSPPRHGAPQDRQQGNNRQQAQTQLTSTTTPSFELENVVEEESFFPWLGGQQEQMRTSSGRTTRPVSDLVGKVRVVPDTRTNSLLLTTNAHFFPQVVKVIDALDVPTPQVLIEARIIEISRDDRERLGTRWSPDKSTFSGDDLDDSVLLSSQTTFKEVFAGRALDTALRTGILNARSDLDILMQFLLKHTSSRVRAEPRINVADNETGRLFVGARVPFITFSTSTAEGGRNDAFQYQDVGIILQVAPHINRDGEVALKISVESSQIRQGETLFGGAIIDTRNYRTDLLVRSGQTLVLGGIIQREESEIERKLFLLGDIPLLGWLFKKRDTVVRDVELMVFLSPKVTRSLEDVEKLMKEEGEKTPQIQRWEKKLDEEAKERKEMERGQ